MQDFLNGQKLVLLRINYIFLLLTLQIESASVFLYSVFNDAL